MDSQASTQTSTQESHGHCLDLAMSNVQWGSHGGNPGLARTHVVSLSVAQLELLMMIFPGHLGR